MTHLLVHLVKEITILGPVFLHNMWPFERFMSVLKKYVLNRAYPEGSIAKRYVTKEVSFVWTLSTQLTRLGFQYHDTRGGY
jgi:hypothetical protein